MHTGILPDSFIQTEFVNLTLTGVLLIKRGWCWDGATMAFDTEDFKLPSCIHDAFYHLLKRGLLDRSWRREADTIMLRFCRFTKMPWWRRAYVFAAVRGGAWAVIAAEVDRGSPQLPRER